MKNLSILDWLGLMLGIGLIGVMLFGERGPSPTVVSSIPTLTPAQDETMSAMMEQGYVQFDAKDRRVLVDREVWNALEAKPKRDLVAVLAIKTAIFNNTPLESIEILDKFTGKRLAEFSISSGVKLF